MYFTVNSKHKFIVLAILILLGYCILHILPIQLPLDNYLNTPDKALVYFAYSHTLIELSYNLRVSEGNVGDIKVRE